MIYPKTAEKWGIFEISLVSAKSFPRPFQEVSVYATFRKDRIKKRVKGFYDGDSTWKIRFMPEETGTYTFEVEANQGEFHGQKGAFTCTGPSSGNHGPVRVSRKYHFSYADGTPFFVMGTTAYAWTYRPEEVRAKTLESFSRYNFNKIRMLVFPKRYVGGHNDINATYEPPIYPLPANLEISTSKIPIPIISGTLKTG